MPEEIIFAGLLPHIGRTVTIFTTSGGISGGGFTGTLASVSNNIVRLITDIGAAPSCPIGSSCGPICNSHGKKDQGSYGNNNPYFWLGSVTEIPISKIASFTHNAI